MKKGWIVIIIIAVLLGFYGCNGYNNLVKQDQTVQTAWSNVETNYQRRSDLYKNMVQTIKGSANFEKSTLTEVINARAQATGIKVNIDDTASIAQFQAAQSKLQGAFSRLIAVSEAYPDLKTTTAFQNLQVSIEGTENRINVARRDYNAAVKTYNLEVKRFPKNILAGIFGFHAKAFFKADAGTQNTPDISF